MKQFLACICLSLALAGGAAAKTDVVKLLAPTDKLIVHRGDVRQVQVYEWEREGIRYNAWPGDPMKPPYDAAVLELRAFSFPTGMVRELFYRQGIRTPPHENMEDIIMYGISGKRVQIVDEDTGILAAGDASFHPVGVSHHSESVIAGTQLEFAFPGTKRPAPRAQWLSGKDVPEIPAAAWVRDGKEIVARGRETAGAPPDAARFTARFFQFPTVTLVEEHLPRGVSLPPHADRRDNLIYVVKGRLRVSVGDTVGEAGEGDVVREPSAVMHDVEALEDTVFVEAGPPEPLVP
jgi:quercetin dioxygenase-like cupin family protein